MQVANETEATAKVLGRINMDYIGVDPASNDSATVVWGRGGKTAYIEREAASAADVVTTTESNIPTDKPIPPGFFGPKQTNDAAKARAHRIAAGRRKEKNRRKSH